MADPGKDEEGEAKGSSDAVTHLCSTVLDLPPSCIEFSQEVPQYFVVGTYNLQKEEQAGKGNGENGDEDEDDSKDAVSGQVEKKNQSRDGSLILFELAAENLSLIQTQTVPSAILDLHFSPHAPSELCIVTSTGTISTYNLSPPASDSESAAPGTPASRKHSLQHLSTNQLFNTETIITAFVFHPTDPSLIAATLTTGTVHLIRGSQGSQPRISEPIITHSLEAWYCAFSPSPGLTLYSGGDDAKLRSVTLSSLPTDEDIEELSSSVTATSPPNGYRGHEAGVTFILPLPSTDGEPQLLLTGSYDDHIRLLSHSSNRIQVVSELYIGGGVWRLKFLDPVPPGSPLRRGTRAAYRILASCMHAGARVLSLALSQEGEWRFEVLGMVEKHKSMNYGSDFQPTLVKGDGGERDKRLVVSTSFYDRLLCVWQI